MSTTAPDQGWLPPPSPPTPASPPSTPSASPAASDRGSTVVTDHAAGRLAMAAASEVDGVVGPSSGGLSGILPSSLSSDEPADIGVRAGVQGDGVSLDLTVGLEYPRPVRSTLEQLARHVGERMREYAGLRVERLDVSVTDLRAPGGPPRPRVQ